MMPINTGHGKVGSREVVLQDDHHACPDRRPDQGADAAEQGHEDHLARHLPLHVGQRCELEHDGLRAARKPRQGRRHDEGAELVAVDPVAQGHGAPFVLANGLEDVAEGRVDDAPDGEKAEQENGEREVVHGERLIQVDQPEKMPARHALDPVLAVGERHLKADEGEHLRERQGDHGEIDPLPANGQEPDHEAHDGRACSPEQNARERLPAPDLDRMGGEIGSPAEEGGVAEGEKSHVTDEQVERAGKQRKAQHAHQKDGIEEERGDDQARKGDGPHRQGGGAQPGLLCEVLGSDSHEITPPAQRDPPA
jgi:hypothetical protein